MDENKIYLTRDKTIWFDLEKNRYLIVMCLLDYNHSK